MQAMRLPFLLAVAFTPFAVAQQVNRTFAQHITCSLSSDIIVDCSGSRFIFDYQIF